MKRDRLTKLETKQQSNEHFLTLSDLLNIQFEHVELTYLNLKFEKLHHTTLNEYIPSLFKVHPNQMSRHMAVRALYGHSSDTYGQDLLQSHSYVSPYGISIFSHIYTLTSG